MEKLLLHICCAPCSVACIAQLREEGIEPVGFWYNPNIHPFTEYRARREALIHYADSIGLSLILEDEYGLQPFVRAVAENIGGRCAYCYACRLSLIHISISGSGSRALLHAGCIAAIRAKTISICNFFSALSAKSHNVSSQVYFYFILP